MGVKLLLKLITENAATAIKEIPVEDLRGWKLGVDVSVSVYQWYSVGLRNKIVNSAGKPINHIQGAFFRTINMILAGIIPVYIFDGIPPVVKRAVLEKRSASRDNGKATRVPREAFEDIKLLMKLMGVPCVQALGEAEATAAALTCNGSLNAVATEDIDAIPFGATIMIKGMSNCKGKVTTIDCAEVLARLNITADQMIDLCILMGCDYTPATMSYSKALNAIRTHGSIESIIAAGIKLPKNFDYISARTAFTASRNTPAETFALRKLSVDDINLLKEFLLTTHLLAANRITLRLKKLAEFNGINI